jgi:DNA-binding transcriptional ArsR family regulator
MAKCLEQALDNAFCALGDATRRGILERLSTGEASVSQLAEPFGVSLPTIHKHLRVLERAGFIAHEKRGRVRHVRLAPARGRRCDIRNHLSLLATREVKDWIERFEARWGDHLQRLKQQVESNL